MRLTPSIAIRVGARYAPGRIDRGGMEDRARWGGTVRRITFYGLAGLYALILLNPAMSPLSFAVLGWVLPTEFGGTSHRVHEITFGIIAAMAFVGLVAQFRKPQRKVAPAQQMVIPIVLLFVLDTIVNGISVDTGFLFVMFLLPPLLIIALHPSRREIIRPDIRPSRMLVGMAVVAAVPLLWFGVQQLQLGFEGAALGRPIEEEIEATLGPDATEDEYSEQFNQLVAEGGFDPQTIEAIEHYFHWAGMTAFALAVVALSFLAASRVPGWRLTAWTAGVALAYYGVASALTPDDASSAGLLWGLLSIVWGGVFVFLAEQEHRDEARAAAEQPT